MTHGLHALGPASLADCRQRACCSRWCCSSCSARCATTISSAQFNILTFLRYNSMFALIALGMCFVIMTGGIDLSVGSTAAMASVVAALSQPLRAPGRPRGRRRAPGSCVGAAQRPDRDPAEASCPSSPRSPPCWPPAVPALLLGDNQSVSVSYDTGFTDLGQGDLLGFPIPAWIAAVAYVAGLGRARTITGFGRARAGRSAAARRRPG